MTKCRAVAFLLLLPLHVGATYFQYNNDFNCTYPVTVQVDKVSCGGTDYCGFGDQMNVYGSMTLEESLPSSEMCVTSKACFMGLSWMCKRYTEEMNVCNALGVSGDYDGTPCPNAGDFYFGSTVEIPGKPRFSLGAGWWVKVDITVEDCNEYKDYSFTCSTSFSAVSADNVLNTTTMAGVGILGAAVLAFYLSRKRRAASIDLAHEEQLIDQATSSGFEMMSDSAVRV